MRNIVIFKNMISGEQQIFMMLHIKTLVMDINQFLKVIFSWLVLKPYHVHSNVKINVSSWQT